MKLGISMLDFQIDKSYAVLASTQALGTQNKFLKDNYWYKYNCLGAEGLAEQLTSDLLACTNISEFAAYVPYLQCRINGKNGCVSKHFLEGGEQLATFAQIYRNVTGRELADFIRFFPDAKSRAEYLIFFFKKYTGVDITDYLYANIAVDYLIRNPDRHFDNLALILQADGVWKPAPIFDNGQGLRQNFSITPPDMEDAEADEALSGATLSGSFSMSLQAMEELTDKRLCIDRDALAQTLQQYTPSIAKDYLMYAAAGRGCHFEDYLLPEPALEEEAQLDIG